VAAGVLPRAVIPRHLAPLVLILLVAVLAACGTAGTVSKAQTATGGPRSDRPLSPRRPPDRILLREARSDPVEDPYYPSTSHPEFDALHYHLDLRWNRARKVLTGTATIRFRVARDTKRVQLSLSARLTVYTVRLDGQRLRWSHGRNTLSMYASSLRRNSLHTVSVAYQGRPGPTPAPSNRPDQRDGLGWVTEPNGGVYTFQEPYGAFTWYPVNDEPSDKALYDIRIHTSGRWQGISNGRLWSSTHNSSGTTNVWHLGSPAASYLITMAIGPYHRILLRLPNGMPVSLWVRPQDGGWVPKLVGDVRSALPWLIRRLGPYPFSTAGIVLVDGTSGMETQTLVTLSASALGRRDSVVAHELAHQWYGDAVTPTSWLGLWLNEGFAMYVQGWYERSTHRYQIAGGIRRWPQYDQLLRNDAGPPGHYQRLKFADSNVYICPALMLDQIRKRIGNRKFDAMMRAWPAQHRYTNQDRASFTRWVDGFTARNLKPLIDRWLDSRTTPR
jgi:aminopeptidase N